ncbi:MAG TPA: threonine/serine exporter family protein [Acidimicrobiales bacterium]|nr:threonine/serine exporter family protein [Acidimicrobiales bacterium]
MTHPEGEGAPGASPPDAPAEAFLIELGQALVRSGETVDEVQRALGDVGRRLGLGDVDVMALPTFILLQSDRVTARVRSVGRSGYRLDQVSDVYDLLWRARRGEVTPEEGLVEIAAVERRRPAYGRAGRSLGLGVLATGFSLMLQPTPEGALISFALGTLVGAAVTQRIDELRPVLPTLMSFVVAAAVFALGDWYGGANPIRNLIPPLVVFLPGAAITAGTIELAAGEAISGASRLVRGLMELLLLAFGITSAAALVGTSQFDLIDRPLDTIGPWGYVPGLVLIALGYHFHMSAPRRSIPWILLVLGVAFAGQSFGAAVFSAELSAFFGALAMTPIVLAIGRHPSGPPSMVLFLPGFYLLVPGAAGLIGSTETIGVGTSLSPSDFVSTMVTVTAIALGVLVGTAVVESLARGRRMLRSADPGQPG